MLLYWGLRVVYAFTGSQNNPEFYKLWGCPRISECFLVSVGEQFDAGTRTPNTNSTHQRSDVRKVN